MPWQEQPDMTDQIENMLSAPLNAAALDQIFLAARSHNAWLDKPLSEKTIRAIYDLAKWGPTSANVCPGRFVFVTTPEGKARIAPHLSENNAEKVAAAPCCVIIARDTKFTELVPELFPGREFIGTYFDMHPELAKETWVRNTTLQGAYLIIAARALGVDAGPMSGFEVDSLNAEFFPDGRWQADFICNLGYGDHSQVWPRNPRLSFETACRIA
jgi:3-hydroxypropanoate dehydrogenase